MREHDLTHPDLQLRPAPEDERLVMTKALGLLYLAGATLGLATVLLPHSSRADIRGLLTNIAFAYLSALAAAALCAGRRPPARWILHLALGAGTILISRAAYLSGDAGSFYPIWYVWVGLYAFYFFSRRAAAAHVALVGASYAAVLVLRSGEGPIPRWLTTLGTVVIAALFIDELVQRVRRHAAASDETAAHLAELLSQLEVVARQDELTMLPNRRAWEEELPRRLAAAARAGDEICVAMLDLDRFKVFNDSHGHQAGDHLLRDVAAAWQGVLRTADFLARYGGEEFALILPVCSLPSAYELVDRLRRATPESATCSAGVSCWDGSEPPEALLSRADEALYTAKAAGRDRTVAANGPPELAREVLPG